MDENACEKIKFYIEIKKKKKYSTGMLLLFIMCSVFNDEYLIHVTVSRKQSTELPNKSPGGWSWCLLISGY